MADNEDPDETARYEPFHLDVHYLQRHLYCSVGMKGLKQIVSVSFVRVSSWCISFFLFFFFFFFFFFQFSLAYFLGV